MSFFSEERASELKELFFESAQELLQALNEEGLELEKKPGDAEIIKSVRRTVHTLKGDSAACGYKELSELAHELEDVLTPELAAAGSATPVAEVVLIAADTFQSLLAAYRGNLQPPKGDALRAQIRRLVERPAAVAPAAKLVAGFAWTEYERLVIADAAARGAVYQVALSIDPNCPMRAAAYQLVQNVFKQAGDLLAVHPENPPAPERVEMIEAAICSYQSAEWIEKKCRVPSVVKDIIVSRFQPGPPPELPGVAAEKTTAVAGEEASAEAAETAAPQAAAFAAAAESTLRVDAERIDDVLNLVGELIIGKSMLHQSVQEFDKKFPKEPLRGKFADAMAFQARVLNDLQKSVMKIRMVPVEQLFRRVPRIIRDVAKSRGKEVGLQVSGQDTDLDKSILDTLAEPLTHLVRNAVDHGIESPEERVKAGKPAQGTIRLNAYHQGNQVVIEVADDGRGIDRAKVVRKAIERKLVSAEEAGRMSEAEGLHLICHSGLSTADEVTAVSGRGVGMDVVKTILDRLKGSLYIETKLGQGTTFKLQVPLTLAIIKALLFRVGERLYAVPLTSVLEIARAKESEFHRVDRNEVMQLRDEVLTLVRLSRLAKSHGRGKRLFIIVITLGDRKFGLVVDRLVGEEELVIKALDDSLVATDMVSGASILGDGTVVLILNIQAVIERIGRDRGKAATA